MDDDRVSDRPSSKDVVIPSVGRRILEIDAELAESRSKRSGSASVFAQVIVALSFLIVSVRHIIEEPAEFVLPLVVLGLLGTWGAIVMERVVTERNRRRRLESELDDLLAKPSDELPLNRPGFSGDSVS
jgi:hypothetical protein